MEMYRKDNGRLNVRQEADLAAARVASRKADFTWLKVFFADQGCVGQQIQPWSAASSGSWGGDW
ncbi:hypothetical protein [Pontibacter rugosus]|uniref:Uncharacterized protein n=1 Tax=Pontibacter rugosus TaxID=1745966 RepID=A0ABW3SSM3_9BACT